MVVSESGLIKAMKEAYKTTGYMVAMKPGADGPDLVIERPGQWKVCISKKNAPGKVLGLIVEHLKAMLEEGEAYQVKKKEVQTELHAVSDLPFMGIDLKMQEAFKIKPTELSLHGCHLWQKDGDNEMVILNPAYENLMKSYGRDVWLFCDQVIALTGAVSSVFFIPEQKTGMEDKQLHHLAGIRWVPEK